MTDRVLSLEIPATHIDELTKLMSVWYCSDCLEPVDPSQSKLLVCPQCESREFFSISDVMAS
jgi:hypothetical protein